MIKIIERDDEILIKTSTTYFIGSISYCEYRIPFYIDGIKPPRNEEAEIRKLRGSLAHIKEEKIEIQSGKVKPMTKEELIRILPDTESDIEFSREHIHSKLTYSTRIDNKNITLFLTGRPDKLLKKGSTLIVEEDKFPNKPYIYLYKNKPFNSQILQALIYLNSQFSITSRKIDELEEKDNEQLTIDQFFNTDEIEEEKENYNPDDWFDIAHQQKSWIINIKKQKEDGNIETIKSFQGVHDKKCQQLLEGNLYKFILLTLDKTQKCHHNSPRKCNACEYSTMCDHSFV